MAASKVIDISSNDTVTRQQRRALERAEEKKHTYLMAAPSRGEVQQFVNGALNQVLPPLVNEIRGNTAALELLALYLETVIPAFKLADLQAFITLKMAEQQKAAEEGGPPPRSGPPEALQEVVTSQEEPLTIPTPQGSIILVGGDS